MLATQAEGVGGSGIVVEQFLEGREVAVAVLSDGHDYCVMPTAREYKRALDGDNGPNTRGMGAYCDDSILTEATRDRVLDTIVEPLLVEMHRRGTPFSGFLRCGLRITTDGAEAVPDKRSDGRSGNATNALSAQRQPGAPPKQFLERSLGPVRSDGQPEACHLHRHGLWRVSRKLLDRTSGPWSSRGGTDRGQGVPFRYQDVGRKDPDCRRPGARRDSERKESRPSDENRVSSGRQHPL